MVNADDANSVKDMCENARILINCVGPVSTEQITNELLNKV